MNNKSGISKLLPIYLSGALAIIIIFVAVHFYNDSRKIDKHVINIGAGKLGSESYEFVTGIKSVAKKMYPDIFEINVIETGGSKENLELIESGEIQFATIQSDIDPNEDLRLISYLYPDFYQIIVKEDSEIDEISDLKERTINITGKSSGQFFSLVELLEHYQIKKDECHFNMGLSTQAIADGLIDESIDAVFRVRSPLNNEIDSIVHLANGVRFIEIDQGEALSYKIPSTYPAKLPKGTYDVNPTIPSKDINSLANNRIFVCDNSLDSEITEIMSELIFERKYLLSFHAPLANFISNPIKTDGTLVPVHSGTKDYFNRGTTPEHIKNAAFYSFLLSLCVSIIAGFFGFNRLFELKRKNKADEAMNKIIEIIDQINNQSTVEKLESLKLELNGILKQMVIDLDVDKIDQNGFAMFSNLYSLAKNELNNMIKRKTS